MLDQEPCGQPMYASQQNLPLDFHGRQSDAMLPWPTMCFIVFCANEATVEGQVISLKDISPFSEFYEPVGELVIAFSILETHLSNTIQLLIGISAEDRILLMEQIRDIERRINFFEASVNGKTKDSDLRKWNSDIAEDLRRANSHRNRIVHGPWNNFDEITKEATKLRFKVKSEYQVKTHKYTPEQIRDIASCMIRIPFRMALMMGYIEHPEAKLEPSPGKLMPPVC
jgi:hypothetical protein